MLDRAGANATTLGGKREEEGEGSSGVVPPDADEAAETWLERRADNLSAS